MIKPGYIRIIDGILKFEYYKLEKPEKPECFNSNSGLRSSQTQEVIYNSQLDKYEASKQTVEVDNFAYRYVIQRKHPYIYSINGHPAIKNNQPCEAEVKNDIATIIELIK